MYCIFIKLLKFTVYDGNTGVLRTIPLSINVRKFLNFTSFVSGALLKF